MQRRGGLPSGRAAGNPIRGCLADLDPSGSWQTGSVRLSADPEGRPVPRDDDVGDRQDPFPVVLDGGLIGR